MGLNLLNILLFCMYSLIKMLYWMCERCHLPPTGRQLEHAIKRNFGGYFDTYSIFANQLGNMSDVKIENEKVSIYCVFCFAF